MKSIFVLVSWAWRCVLESCSIEFRWFKFKIGVLLREGDRCCNLWVSFLADFRLPFICLRGHWFTELDLFGYFLVIECLSFTLWNLLFSSDWVWLFLFCVPLSILCNVGLVSTMSCWPWKVFIPPAMLNDIFARYDYLDWHISISSV